MIPLVWCAMIGTILFGGLFYYLVVGRLRRYHPLVWKNLGEPRALLAASTRRSTIGDFIRNRKYRELGDTKLTRLVMVMRVTTLVSLVLFCLGVVLILTATIQNGA